MKGYCFYFVVLTLLSLNPICNAAGNVSPVVKEWCAKVVEKTYEEACIEFLQQDPRSVNMKSPQEEVPVILLDFCKEDADASLKITEAVMKTAAEDSKYGPPEFIELCKRCNAAFKPIPDQIPVHKDMLKDPKNRVVVADWMLKTNTEVSTACKSNVMGQSIPDGLPDLIQLVKGFSAACEITSRILKAP